MTRFKHCISISDFSKQDILDILEKAKTYEANHKQPNVLKDTVVASLFFEPSTRTRLSFESATKYLGGQVIGFASGTTSSVAKGETIEDTIKMVMCYSDLIVMRHPEVGSAKKAVSVSNVPIINGGDGHGEHPTQTLLDLYSIAESQGTLSGLTIGLSGDLKYSRTIHSLIKALSQFNAKYILYSPTKLPLPDEYKKIMESHNCDYVERNDFSDLSELDILYVTRVQRERFDSQADYEEVKDDLLLKKSHIVNTKKSLRILSPLPRVNELDFAIDDMDEAYYFQQAQNGLYVRQALLDLMLN